MQTASKSKIRNVPCRSIKGNTVPIPVSKLVFRPSVYAVIIDQGSVLLLNNRTSKRLFFPGGGVEQGETLMEALKREVKEETGLEVRIEKFLDFRELFFYYDPKDEAFQMYNFFYLCSPILHNMHDDASVNDAESEKPRWYALEEVKKGILPLDKTAIEILSLL